MLARGVPLLLVASLALGCASPRPTEKLGDTRPRSILVVPPVIETKDVQSARVYGATLTRVLVDRGYYVFPSSVVTPVLGRLKIDASSAGALDRLERVFGADAILVTRIRSFSPRIEASYQLLDARSGRELWHAEVNAEPPPNAAALEAVALGANAQAFADLPVGPQYSRLR